MKFRALLTATMISALVLSSAARTNGQAEPAAKTSEQVPPNPERVAIRTVLATQVAEWNRGRIDAFMEGYWNSPDTEFVSSNGILRGWKTVLQRYHKQYPDRATMGHLTFTNLEVNLLAPDAALVVGRWQLKRQNDTPNGVFTLVLKKFADGWRIINDHTSQSPSS